MRPDFYARLQKHQQRLRTRGFIFLFSVWALASSAVLLLIAGVELFITFREFPAFVLALIVSLGAVIAFPALFEIFRRRNPVTTRSIARHIEDAHPELMDGLNCSVDIIEGRRDRSSWFAPQLIQQTDERMRHLSFEEEQQPAWARPALLAILLIAALTLGLLAQQTRFSQKAYFGFLHQVGLTSGGLHIAPAELAVPVHGDLEIEVQVHRWEQQAEILYSDTEGDHRYPVVFDADGIGRFRFYDVTAPIEFQVLTPSLASETRTIESFIPPKIEAASIVVIAPAYSGLEDFVTDALSDLEVLEGSEILFDLRAPLAGGELVAGDRRLPLGSFGEDRWQVSITPRDDTTYLFELRSPTGHTTQTRPHDITVNPDEPPMVEIWNPGEDVTAEPGVTVPLELYAADDFGVAELLLFVSVSGQARRILPVPVPQTEEGRAPLEAELQSALDLGRLEAVDGDVIAYYAVVSDNREPAANSVRSEIFFIEVRVEKPPVEMPGGMPMEQDGLDMRAFIVELKRLIRETYTAAESTGDVRQRKNQEVGADLGTLRNELGPTRDIAAPLLLGTPLESVIDWFDEALIRLEQAELLVNGGQSEEAIRFEEQALSNLVRIENALRMNVISKESSSGSEGESSSESQSQQESTAQSESQSQNQGQNPIEAINEMRADLERMIAKQNRLNAEMDQQQRQGASQEAMDAVAERQEALREELRELDDSMRQISDAAGARSELRDARRQMQSAANSMSAGNPREGYPSGMRAREAMLAASAELEAMAANAAASAVAALGQAAGNLARQQAELAGESAAAEAGERDGEGLYEQQNDLAAAFEELQQQLAAGERMLESLSPEMAEAMAGIREQAASSDTGREMSRAANALLYNRFGRAQQSQRSAESSLRDLEAQLEELEGMRPEPDAAALERAIAQLERDRERLQEGTSPGDQAGQSDAPSTGPMSEKWSQRLEDLAQGLQDDALSQMSGAIGRIGLSEAANTTQLTSLLESAQQQLTRHWIQAMRERKLDVNRESAPPPAEYQRQVEAYFRSLAEDE